MLRVVHYKVGNTTSFCVMHVMLAMIHLSLTEVACWEEKYGTLWGLADLSGAQFPGLKNGGYSSYKSLGWM